MYSNSTIKIHKTLKIKTSLLISLIIVFLLSILNIGKLNLIIIGLNETKQGWNTYPPLSTLDNRKLQESLNLDPKLIFFEVFVFVLITYLSIDIYQKIQKR